VELVPLDLVGDDRRDQVVQIGGGGDVGGEGAVAVVEPAATATGGGDGGPAVHAVEAGAGEGAGGLTEHDPADVDDPGREALGRVEEGVHVGFGFGGAGVQRRGGGQVGRFEAGDADRAGALEQGGVGADVEVDLALARGEPRQTGGRVGEVVAVVALGLVERHGSFAGEENTVVGGAV
jgi:hypothetical protein